MPSPKLTPQQKWEKQDTVSSIYETALSIIEESRLYGSNLWPKNGFMSGWQQPDKLDTIGLVISVSFDPPYKLLQLNIWAKSEARARKQNYELSLIFDQAYKNGYTFSFDFELAAYKCMGYYRTGCFMCMIRLVLN